MHILIIGCGYLGLRVAQAGLQAGHQITALTRQPERSAEWAALGIRPVIGDVLHPASLRSLPAADLCLYAVGYDRSAAADKRTVYVDGLHHVLQEISSRVPRLLFISSTSVYGQSAGEIVNEHSLCDPQQEAGRICCAAEEVVRDFYPAGQGNFPALILRFSGIYGPGRLIARCDQLRQGIPVAGNPDAWLNLIHVDDAVQAVLRLAGQTFAAPLYLLSDAAPLRRRAFYGAIATHLGAPAPIFTHTADASLNKRCDSSLIRTQLPLQLSYPNALDALPALL